MGKETDDHLQGVTECPDCASENIVHSAMRDQIICKDCGLVFEPFTPVEAPAAAVRPAAAKKAKPAKTKKAKKSPKAKRAKARPAKKARKKPARKKWGWW